MRWRSSRAGFGDKAPRLRISRHYAPRRRRGAGLWRVTQGRRAGRLAESDIDGDMTQLYRSSLLCLLPFTGSFAGLPAGVAAAQSIADHLHEEGRLPGHIGDCGCGSTRKPG